VAAQGDAGVVDEDVDAIQLLHGVDGEPVDRRGVGQVDDPSA
jgi:hypothetical protein